MAKTKWTMVLIALIFAGLVTTFNYVGCGGDRDSRRNEALSQITSQDRDKWEHALEVIVEVNAKEAIPAITKLLQDKDQKIRRRAVTALQELGAKEAIPEIIKLLNDPEVSGLAVEALEKLGAKEAIPAITKLLQDHNSWVRQQAVSALGKLGAKESIPELVEHLADTFPINGLTAIALVELGAKDKVVPINLVANITLLSTEENYSSYWLRARATLKELGVPNPEEEEKK